MLLIAAVVSFFVVRRLSRRGTSDPRPELGPVGWIATVNWAVAPPLGRIELKRFLRHPAFIAGVVISPLMLMLATVADGPHTEWSESSPSIALALVPLGWLIVVATQLLTTRPVRTGTDALFAALPAPQPVRTAGVLTCMVGAVGVAAVIAAAWALYLPTRIDLIGSPNIADIAAGVFIAAGSVCVGVAVGRFLPHPAFGIGAAFACAFIQVRFFEIGSWPWNLTQASPYRFLGFLAEPTSGDGSLEIRPAGWHLLYLAGLVAFMGCVALARNGVPRSLAAVTAGAVGLTAIAGWVQTRPPSETRVMRMVSYLEHPERRHTCTTANSAQYCAFPASAALVGGWQRIVGQVLSLVPPVVAARPLKVADRPATVIGDSNCSPIPFTESLVAEVGERIDPERVWPADGAIHPGVDTFPCSDRGSGGLFLAVQAGAWAVGLPASPHGRDVRCTADGQARSVVALWLAAAASPDGAKTLDEVRADARSAHLDFEEWNFPPMWGVTFSRADMALAVSMARRPLSEVQPVIVKNWSLLTEPSTLSSALASLVGAPDVRTLAASPDERACA